jgi:hypothetical protein
LVSALYWACYITEFDIFESGISISSGVEESDEEIWGILSDIETEDFNYGFDWIDDIKF